MPCRRRGRARWEENQLDHNVHRGSGRSRVEEGDVPSSQTEILCVDDNRNPVFCMGLSVILVSK